MSNFTQDDWKVRESETPGIIYVDCGDCMSVMIVTNANDISWEESFERKTNARLMSLSPKMYHLLEKLADTDECQMHKTEINQLLSIARNECYYDEQGTLRSPDGSRSIFDDVDQ